MANTSGDTNKWRDDVSAQLKDLQNKLWLAQIQQRGTGQDQTAPTPAPSVPVNWNKVIIFGIGVFVLIKFRKDIFG